MTEQTYEAWIARKQTTLRRPVLDCGCRNCGEVAFHLWCDRLACETHAEDPHDCSAFAGVKSGIEEESEQAEAVVEAPTVRPRDSAGWPPLGVSNAEFLALLNAANRARDEIDGSAPNDRVADAFRAEVRRQGLAPCEIEIDGRPEMLDDEPLGLGLVTAVPGPGITTTSPRGVWSDIVAVYERIHDAPYRPDPPPVLTRGSAEEYNREMARLRARDVHPVAAALQPDPDVPRRCLSKIAHESGVVKQCQFLHVQIPPVPDIHGTNDGVLWRSDDDRVITEGVPAPEPTYHRYECPHPGCDWVRVALDLDVFDGLLAEHERTAHADPRRPWWKRWWSRWA